MSSRRRVMLDMLACFPYMWCALAFPAASLERRLVQILRAMFPLVPAARLLVGTFSTTYRSHYGPATDRLWLMAVWLVCACHWTGCLWWLVGLKQASLPHDPDSP